MKTQKEKVLEKLKEKKIDTIWGINNGILRLAEIVSRLKKDGYNIITVQVYKNKKLQKYAGYELIE